ncbi:MAG TPA: hypothetical protein VH912_10555 [Streptosporangiaceae bacterium]|jgi:succinate dehydrogenase / fumarate reductase cytochrome b subunit
MLMRQRQKPDVAAKPAARQRSAPAWVWLAQVGTGALLLVLLTLHMIAQHYVAAAGLRTYAEVVDWLRNPVVFVIELAFLVTVTWHALLGLRGILLDFGPRERTERLLTRGLMILGVATVSYGAWLLITIAGQG